MTQDAKRNSGRRWVLIRRTNGSFGSFVSCGFGVISDTDVRTGRTKLVLGTTNPTRRENPFIERGEVAAVAVLRLSKGRKHPHSSMGA
jgi:hypothetical protein